MSRLYLRCGLCARQQADGLLSRGYWGHLTVNGQALQVCPACKVHHSDWEDRLRASCDPAAYDGQSFTRPSASPGTL